MQLDLQENMYVRTKYGISQYKYYDTTNGKLLCIPVKDGSRGIFVNVEDIIKADYKIIKILEVGDYVNSHRVIFVNDTFTYASVEVETSGEATCEIIPKNNIKSVITHEQMEQIAYKVEE